MSVKAQLLEAALQVYAESGCYGATTRRIAAAAGVNQITLFRHFGSKDVLLREALWRCQAEGTIPLPDPPQDPLQELTDWSHLLHLHQRAALIRTCQRVRRASRAGDAGDQLSGAGDAGAG